MEADDLARKVEFLLSAAKAAALAPQNAAPAGQKTVPDTHTGGEYPVDPLSTEKLDALIRGTQLPPPADPGTTPALCSIPRARSWRTLSVCLHAYSRGSRFGGLVSVCDRRAATSLECRHKPHCRWSAARCNVD